MPHKTVQLDSFGDLIFGIFPGGMFWYFFCSIWQQNLLCIGMSNDNRITTNGQKNGKTEVDAHFVRVFLSLFSIRPI